MDHQSMNQSMNQSHMCETGISSFNEYVCRSLVKRYGQENKKNIERYINRMSKVIIKDVLDLFLTTLPHMYYSDDSSIKTLQLNTYEKKWGRISIDKKQVWANGPLSHILFDIVYPGKKGVATAARIKDSVMDSLTQYAIEENTDTNWKVEHNFDFVTQDVLGTPIDTESLKSALNKWGNEVYLLKGKDKDKALRNIAMAKMILSSLVNGELLQEMDIKASGRMYFKGLNLQNASKAVRHAALGKCHLYDMRVGSFGVMAALAKDYATECGITANFHNIRGYIQNKESYRIRVTKAVYPDQTKNFTQDDFKKFFGYYNVKNALTAIGFGAKRNVTATWKDINDKWQQTSLNSAFKNNRDEAERFINCNLISALVDEYVECTKIVDLRLEQDIEFRNLFAITDDMKKGQRLAMVYQTMETVIMSQFMSHCTQENILLPVHDGVYLKYKIDYKSIHFNFDIPFITDKEFIQLDHTQYGLSDIDSELTHSEFIKQQERIANDGNISTTAKRQVMTQWGLIDEDQISTQDPYYGDAYYNTRY